MELTLIGIIRTPYGEPREIPIQGRFQEDVEGRIELEQQ
jgi:tRNA (Thr-GGU) A37 N-methylase